MSRRRTVVRASVVCVLVVSAFVISSGTLVAAERISETNRSTLARVNANFGANYGVVDVVKRTGEEIPGIQSTTVELSVKDSSITSMNEALNYVTQTLTNLKNEEVVNVFINGTSEDESQTFSYKFYGASPDDFSERDFLAGVDVVKRMYAGEAKNIAITSTPDLDGTRSVDTVITFSDDYVDAINLQSTWDKSVNAVVEDLPSDTSNLYSLSVVNENESSGPGITFKAFYYDADTLNAVRAVDGNVWKALSFYATDTNLNKFPLKQVTYVDSLTVQNSSMELLFEGDGAGLDNLSLLTAFNEVAGKHPEIQPHGYSKQLRYEAHADAFYTGYAN